MARTRTGGSSSSVEGGMPKTRAELLGVKLPPDPVRVARLNRSQAQVGNCLRKRAQKRTQHPRKMHTYRQWPEWDLA